MSEICEICGKEVATEHNLKMHMRTHENEAEKKQEARKKRLPLGVPRAKLSFDVPDGFVGRIVNDTPGRLEQARDGGYEPVLDRDGKQLGQDNGNSDLGSGVSRIVGKGEYGEPIRGHLMMIRKDLYDQDQKAKMEEVDQVDEAIKNGGSQFGTKQNPVDGKYVDQVKIQHNST